MHFRVVSKGQGTELGIFLGFVIFHFFWGGGGGLDIPDNFGEKTVDAKSKPMYEEKNYSTTTPPPPPPPYLDPDKVMQSNKPLK